MKPEAVEDKPISDHAPLTAITAPIDIDFSIQVLISRFEADISSRTPVGKYTTSSEDPCSAVNLYSLDRYSGTTILMQVRILLMSAALF